MQFVYDCRKNKCVYKQDSSNWNNHSCIERVTIHHASKDNENAGNLNNELCFNTTRVKI